MAENKEIYELLLEEWRDLREEIHIRVQQTDKYTEFSLIAISAYIAFYNSIEYQNRVILVGFPLILYALIFLTVRSDYIILNIVKYTHHHLLQNIEKIISCDKNIVFQWERFRYRSELVTSPSVKFLSVFLTGVRFGIPFLSTLIISLLYYIKFGISSTKEDIIVICLFLFGTILFLFVMVVWIPYCKKSYNKLFLLNINFENFIP